MKILRRDDKMLELDEPINNITEELIDELSMKDLYLHGDLIDNNSRVIYIFDTAWQRVYWGYLGQRIFEREPDEEVEQELLNEY